jgi:TonB family protein
MNFLHYLLQVNLYLVLFYGFYRVLLAGETFHQANRAYLVAGAALALFIPVCHSEWVRGWFVTERVHAAVYAFYDPGLLIVRPVAAQPGLTWGQVVALGYGLGALVALARFSAQAVRLGWLLRGRSLKRADRGAFSFFNFLFISPELRRQAAILEHERVHVRQLHSADVLLMELLAVVCWFNPMVYAYRRSLRHLHEFIADEVASRRAPSKAAYAQLLFRQQLGAPLPAHPFTHSFFGPSALKRRIAMLQKPRSRRVMLLKYGLSAPLFGVMLLLSSAGVNRHEALRRVENVLTSDAEVLPPPPPPAPLLPQTDPAVDLSKAVLLSPVLKRELGRQDTIFSVVEHPAQFSGGFGKMTEFLSQNLQYPADARRAKIQGKVFLSFVVNRDGSLSDIHVLKGIGYGCDEEAVRVLSRMPNWEPGRQNGQSVKSRFNLPIAFSLAGGPLPDNSPRQVITIRVKNQARGTVLPLDNLPLVLNNGRVIYFDASKNQELVVNDFQFLPLDIAKVRYGELGRNGALLLTTDSTQLPKSVPTPPTGSPSPNLLLKAQIQLHAEPNAPGPSPLFLLDGKEISTEEVNKIDPKTIESIQVLKEAAEVAPYGKKGKGDVIIITLKKK